MTDKEYNTQKKRVKALIKKWHKLIGLNWWRVTYSYSRTVKDDNDTTYDPGRGWAVAADCDTDSNYLTATITFYLPNVADIPDEYLEEIYLHEVMHIFINPMQTKEKAAEEERVATTLARAMAWASEMYKKPEKKKKSTSRRPRKTPQKRLKKKSKA